jgi:hypothetical protein
MQILFKLLSPLFADNDRSFDSFVELLKSGDTEHISKKILEPFLKQYKTLMSSIGVSLSAQNRGGANRRSNSKSR